MKRIIFLVLSFCLSMSTSHACTIWGAIKSNEILIAKNRDFYPGNQEFRVVQAQHKYAFFGLYGDNEYDKHYKLKMGVNEKGLVVFMTFASTIPDAQRHVKISYDQVMEKILQDYQDIDSIYKNKEKLFHDSTPINYVFSDRNKAMICEIGLENHYQCQLYTREKNKIVTFVQTNHYILNHLVQYNITPIINQQTSYRRLIRINALMKNNIKHLDFQHWVDFSLNMEATNDDPVTPFDTGYNNTYQDNSIFRTFNSHPDRKEHKHKNSDQNVSNMIVELPKDKTSPIKLYLRIIDKITDLKGEQDAQNIQYTMAITTLETAIQHSDNINYQKKTCVRNKTSIQCTNLENLSG